MSTISEAMHRAPAGGEYYVFRDPVYNLIEITDDEDGRFLRGLLATREMQRLRLIKQNGFSALVYPGLEGSRFPHSLGTYHISRRIIRSLKERQPHASEGFPDSFRLSEADCRAFPIAALLHDIGHGPLSHVWEETMAAHPYFEDHERIGLAMLTDQASEVGCFLKNVDRDRFPNYSGIYNDVLAFLTKTHRLSYLYPLLSGNLDVDRLDFMARDTLMAGVTYGLHELEWLIRSFRFARLPSHLSDTGRAEWIIAVDGRKGLSALTQFLRARENMYSLVYHHKTTQAAQLLFQSIFRRGTDLAKLGELGASLTDRRLEPWVLGQPFLVSDFVALDDNTIWSQVKQWASHDDGILNRLCRDLLRRKLFKIFPLSKGAARALRLIDDPANGQHLASLIAARRGSTSALEASYLYGFHRTVFYPVGRKPKTPLETVWILEADALGHNYTSLHEYWERQGERAADKVENDFLGVHRDYVRDVIKFVDLFDVRERETSSTGGLSDNIGDVVPPEGYAVVANLGKFGVWKRVYLGVTKRPGADRDSIVALKCYRTDDKDAIARALLRDVLQPNLLAGDSEYLSRSGEIGEREDRIWLKETLWTGTIHDLITHGGPSRNILEVARMGHQLFRGLAAMHSKNLRHTDIKPDNCGFIQEERTSRRYLIGDFGCLSSHPSKVPGDPRLLGTQRTRAPEVWRDPANVSLKMDVWALAATLYAVTQMKYPFASYDMKHGSTEERLRREEEVRQDLEKLLTAFLNEARVNLPPVLTNVLLPCFSSEGGSRPDSLTVAQQFEELCARLARMPQNQLQAWQLSEDIVARVHDTAGPPETKNSLALTSFAEELEWLANDAAELIPSSTLENIKAYMA